MEKGNGGIKGGGINWRKIYFQVERGEERDTKVRKNNIIEEKGIFWEENTNM